MAAAQENNVLQLVTADSPPSTPMQRRGLKQKQDDQEYSSKKQGHESSSTFSPERSGSDGARMQGEADVSQVPQNLAADSPPSMPIRSRGVKRKQADQICSPVKQASKSNQGSGALANPNARPGYSWEGCSDETVLRKHSRMDTEDNGAGTQAGNNMSQVFYPSSDFRSSAPLSSSGGDGENVELVENREERSAESGTSGSLNEFLVEDASFPEDNPMSHAAVDNDRLAALEEEHVPQHHPLDEDFLGQLWFHKKAPAVLHQQANRHALIGSCDLNSSGRHKKFSSFADAGAFVGYLERLRAEGIVLNHYECIDAHTSSKFYVDIDYYNKGRDEGDF